MWKMSAETLNLERLTRGVSQGMYGIRNRLDVSRAVRLSLTADN